MIKHVIFDCFGTLIDTGSGSLDAARQILENVGGKQDVKEFYKKWKQIKKDMMSEEAVQTEEVFHTAKMVHVDKMFLSEKKLFELSLSKMFELYGIQADASKEVEPMIHTLFGVRKVYADVQDILCELEKAGIEYAIGSTTDTDSLMHFLNLNHLTFDKIFTSEDMKAYKPDPKFYETILERTGWKIQDCLFVGDSLIDDVMGPQRVGMKAVLLDRKGEYSGTSREGKPDYVIASLAELKNLLN